MRSDLVIWVGPKFNSLLKIENTNRVEAIWRWRQRLELCSQKSENIWIHQKPDKARKDCLLDPLEEAQPMEYLDLDLWPGELWQNKFLLFKAKNFKFAVIFLHYPRNWYTLTRQNSEIIIFLSPLTTKEVAGE